MHEIIRNVIEAEKTAKHLVETANGEAAQISFQAQKEAEEILAKSEEETRRKVATILEDAIRSAEEEKRERLVQAKGEIESRMQLDEEVKREVVKSVIRCVCGIK